VFFLSIVLFIAFNVLSVIFPKYSNLFITSMFDWYVLWNVDIIPLDKTYTRVPYYGRICYNVLYRRLLYV